MKFTQSIRQKLKLEAARKFIKIKLKKYLIKRQSQE